MIVKMGFGVSLLHMVIAVVVVYWPVYSIHQHVHPMKTFLSRHRVKYETVRHRPTLYKNAAPHSLNSLISFWGGNIQLDDVDGNKGLCMERKGS